MNGCAVAGKKGTLKEFDLGFFISLRWLVFVVAFVWSASYHKTRIAVGNEMEPKKIDKKRAKG